MGIPTEIVKVKHVLWWSKPQICKFFGRKLQCKGSKKGVKMQTILLTNADGRENKFQEFYTVGKNLRQKVTYKGKKFVLPTYN